MKKILMLAILSFLVLPSEAFANSGITMSKNATETVKPVVNRNEILMDWFYEFVLIHNLFSSSSSEVVIQNPYHTNIIRFVKQGKQVLKYEGKSNFASKIYTSNGNKIEITKPLNTYCGYYLIEPNGHIAAYDGLRDKVGEWIYNVE